MSSDIKRAVVDSTGQCNIMYTGKAFLKKFGGKNGLTEESILGFIGDGAEIDDLNRNSRVILMARSFDSTLFSMGEWLSSKGVPFRCITYSPVEISDRQFLSFSVIFDRALDAIYPLSFGSKLRQPGFYWHNIASTEDSWWQWLVTHQQIPACFEGAPGDQGEKIMQRYVPGDTIIAYAKGYGAVGYGTVANPANYRLVSVGSEDDFAEGDCRHRLTVEWKSTASVLEQGIRPGFVRSQFGIYHPVSTSVSMDSQKGQKLVEEMTRQFSS